MSDDRADGVVSCVSIPTDDLAERCRARPIVTEGVAISGACDAVLPSIRCSVPLTALHDRLHDCPRLARIRLRLKKTIVAGSEEGVPPPILLAGGTVSSGSEPEPVSGDSDTPTLSSSARWPHSHSSLNSAFPSPEPTIRSCGSRSPARSRAAFDLRGRRRVRRGARLQTDPETCGAGLDYARTLFGCHGAARLFESLRVCIQSGSGVRSKSASTSRASPARFKPSPRRSAWCPARSERAPTPPAPRRSAPRAESCDVRSPLAAAHLRDRADVQDCRRPRAFRYRTAPLRR